MKYSQYSLIVAATLVLSACSPTGTPLIDMCQKITQNLVGSVESWKEPEKSERNRHMFVTVAYTTGSGESGSAECDFPPEGEKGAPGNPYRTSPISVSLNGQTIPQKQLMQASFSSSKEVLKETAQETKEQASELAEDIKEKSGEMAVKAEELAGEAKVKATELAGDAKVKAAELAKQATEVAGAATDKAREAAIEAAKTVQETLEK